MTVLYKSTPQGSGQGSDRARLRGKLGGLLHYIWRGDLDALRHAGMGTELNAYHADLLKYVRRDGHKEEVAAKLTRNLISAEPEELIAELEALREDAGAGDSLVEHYIISVRPGDRLLENFDEASDTFLNGLGLDRCPAVAAVHLDTDNPHVHIMVLRVDCETGEEVKLPRYDVIRGHQMLAVLEHKFGWSREAESRWQVLEGRLVRDGSVDLGPADDPSQWPDEYVPRGGTSPRGRRKESSTGIKCAESIVRDRVPQLIGRHENLSDFLAALQREGITLARKGSGAQYRVTFDNGNGTRSTEDVVASTLRAWPYQKLTDRYGALPENHREPRAPRPIESTDGDPRRLAYAQARARHYERQNFICRDVRSAVGNAAGLNRAIVEARAACVFPPFGEWVSGGSAPDIGAVLFERLGLFVVEARGQSHWRDSVEVLLHTGHVGRKSGHRVLYKPRGRAGADIRITDFGDRVIVSGQATVGDYEKALMLFQVRGASTVSASGLSLQQFRQARDIARKRGIELVRAENPLAISRQPTGAKLLIHGERDQTADVRRRSARSSDWDMQRLNETSVEKAVRSEQPPAEVLPVGGRTARAAQPTEMPEQFREWNQAAEAYQALVGANADRAHLRAAQHRRDLRAWVLRKAVRRGEVDRALLDHGAWARMERQAADHEGRQRQIGLGSGIGM